MSRTITVPEGFEVPILGGVIDATVHMPVDSKIRDFIQRTGFLRAPEEPSPLTDHEIRALSGDSDLDVEISRSYLVDEGRALSRLQDSAYMRDEETGGWGWWSEFGPRRLTNDFEFRDLMPLLEIAEHKIPRFIGCALGAQYFALDLTEEAKPHKDPGFLHYWTVVGKDAETGATRVDLLDRDTYEEYMGKPYPVPEKSEPEDIQTQ